MNRRMKTRLAAGVTAGAMMLALPGMALAQPTQANDTAQINTGTLISALNNINAEINNLEALNNLTVEDVQVVDVDNVLNNNNVQALNNSLNNNDVDALQNFLNDNEVIKNALNNNNVTVDDVVAVDVLSDGSVVVFVD